MRSSAYAHLPRKNTLTQVHTHIVFVFPAPRGKYTTAWIPLEATKLLASLCQLLLQSLLHL